MPLEDDEQPLETFLVSRFRGEKRFVCSFIWSSYCNPRDTSSATDISRRMCMIFTLIANAIFDTYPQYMRLRNHEYPAFAIWLVINALFFVACAFLLAVIGNVVGERVVLGMRVVRLSISLRSTSILMPLYRFAGISMSFCISSPLHMLYYFAFLRLVIFTVGL